MANYRALAAAAARRYGIPVNIFLRQIAQESGFNPNARSSAGALGIAQFMPATARGMGVNPLDPRSALFGAARMDAENLRRYGSWQDVLSAYNSGRPWAQGRNIAQTRDYVRSILGGSAPPAASMGAPGGSPQASGAAPSPDARAAVLNALLQIHGPRSDISPLLAALHQAGQGGVSSAPSPPLSQTVGGQTSVGPSPRGGSSLSFLEPIGQRFGLSITSTTGGKHVPGSYHYQGRAVDFAGDPNRMMALMQYALHHPGQFVEAFYDPAHAYVKNGRVYRGQIGGHTDHVHLAR